jgi:hypothetical protein
MESYDIYKIFSEIKAGQDRTNNLITESLKSNSKLKIYDLVELKTMFKVSTRTMATWLQKGIISHTKVGAKIWVTELQLQEFLEKYSNDHILKNSVKIGRRAV